jgi:tetratricopeptide (TPR) repeat protein
VDAADLDVQTRTYSGCIPPDLVCRLLELGHAAVVEFWAGRGEWPCAEEWAWLLSEQGQPAEALQVLAPYVATGWGTAVRFTAELLEEWGRAGEAIALTRRHAKAGDRLMADFLGRLLARHDRGDEAFGLLKPHIRDRLLAEALVEVAEVTGRDEEAAVLLAARIEAGTLGETPVSRTMPSASPDYAISLLAGIRERQGRIDEAVALLHTRETTSVNNRDQLADLLVRHGRIEELRAYAAAEQQGHAAQRLAEVLEEQGDVDAAIAVYQQPGDSQASRVYGGAGLARLLERHSRGAEAITVLRSLADSHGADDWIAGWICALYSDQGRAQDGLAYLDALKSRDGEEDWEFFRIRLKLMFASGRRDEAIEQARAHPEWDSWHAASDIGEMLAEAGLAEQAVAVLEQHSQAAGSDLARHLIDLGRVDDAVAVLHQRKDRQG